MKTAYDYNVVDRNAAGKTEGNGIQKMQINFAIANSLKDAPAAVPLARFGELFGKNYLWAYRLMKSGKLKVVAGYGRVMVPKEEAVRIINEAVAVK